MNEGIRLRRYADALVIWYEGQLRPLPWRTQATPYRVWVSEIMLQQTRIEAVRPYFDRFMKALPTVESLAAAPEDALMKLWEGLGYYSRVRNLQKAAQLVMEQYGGELPHTYEGWLTLPGVGPYTAGAVASIAFQVAVPAVDGNVLRVLARLTACKDDITRPATIQSFRHLAQEILPVNHAGAFNQAIMELGETICLPNTVPHCEVCPLSQACMARAQGIAQELPVRTPKKSRKVEQRTILVVISSESVPRVLLHKRKAKGLLAGMWELPNTEGWLSEEQVIMQAKEWGITPVSIQPLGESKHIFTHMEWHMQGYSISGEITVPADCILATDHQIRTQYALPTAFRPYAVLLPDFLQQESELCTK